MSHRFFAALLGITVALTGAAGAAEVTRSIEVTGDKAEVWARIGGWCAIADWHPAIATCEEAEEGGKQLRTLTTGDGAVIKETLLESGEASYSYRIDESPLPVANYTASLSLTSDADKVNITWSANFDPKGDEVEAKNVIGGIFDGGLAGIATMLK
jgi:hypothetical protein